MCIFFQSQRIIVFREWNEFLAICKIWICMNICSLITTYMARLKLFTEVIISEDSREFQRLHGITLFRFILFLTKTTCTNWFSVQLQALLKFLSNYKIISEENSTSRTQFAVYSMFRASILWTSSIIRISFIYKGLLVDCSYLLQLKITGR